jgi:LPS-assembly protein
LPQISVRGELPTTFGLDFDVDSEYTYFERSESITGSRLDLRPGVRMPLRTAGAYVEPSLSWSYTTYALNNTAAGVEDSPSRSAPIASLDAGLTFERLTGSRQQRLQTFEPRFLYLYVPYRDQTDLPVFDTAEPDLNLVQLFSENRYVGPDRLGDANQLSVGFTTRLLDSNSGRQYLSATAGQAYYFDTPRVVLPNEPVLAYNSSNMVAQLEISAFKDWNVRMGSQWDPHETRSEKGEARVQYSPAHDKVINVGYRFRRDSLEQWEASFAWPVTDTWSSYGGITYSMKDDATIGRFAGFQYSSCCWKVRVVAREYVSSRTGETNSDIQLQLELNGLAGVGSGVDAFLERSIRGYSPLPSEMP